MWQTSRELCNTVYSLTLKGSFAQDYKLRDQINGSSVSVMDNIAEGFERDGKAEFRQFLSIAKGSSGEVRSQLYRALDRNHISQSEFDASFSLAETTSKKLSSLMGYLKKSVLTGTKYKAT